MPSPYCRKPILVSLPKLSIVNQGDEALGLFTGIAVVNVVFANKHLSSCKPDNIQL